MQLEPMTEAEQNFIEDVHQILNRATHGQQELRFAAYAAEKTGANALAPKLRALVHRYDQSSVSRH